LTLLRKNQEEGPGSGAPPKDFTKHENLRQFLPGAGEKGEASSLFFVCRRPTISLKERNKDRVDRRVTHRQGRGKDRCRRAYCRADIGKKGIGQRGKRKKAIGPS